MPDGRAPVFETPRADRHRPDRLVDRARGARARGSCAASSRPRARPRPARGSPNSGSADQVVDTNAAAVARRRPRHPVHAGRAMRPRGGGDRAASRRRAPSSPMSARSKAPWSRRLPARADGCPFRSRPSGRRHRVFRTGRRLCRAVHQSLVHPDAARGRRPDRRREARGVLDARSAPMWRRCRRTTTTACWRSPATCRISSPTPLSAPPTSSRQVTQLGSAEILRRRLSRLHPHRRLRSDHVARRLPRQQGRGAGNARHASARTCRSSPAPSGAATATRCSTCSPAPGRSAAASSRSARMRRRPISAVRMTGCRRCPAPMRVRRTER